MSHHEPAAPSLAMPHPDPPPPHDDAHARWWLEHVYQGDRMPQLSVRSIVTGMLIGAVMSISNLYVGLKTGWGLGVTITACIIAYAVFRSLETVVPAYRRRPFSILENYTMSSAASAAGYMASSGLVSAIPALYLVGGRSLAWWEMMCWLGSVSVLGVFMAVPLKRQLINVEQLPFPSGIATAETLKSMHAAGAAHAAEETTTLRSAEVLLWTGVAGAVVGFWHEGWEPLAHWLGARLGSKGLGAWLGGWALPDDFPLFPGGRPLLEHYTFGFEGSLLLGAAGAIMGLRAGVSLLVGAIAYFGILAPLLIERGAIVMHPGADAYKTIVAWTLWPASAMMVTSGLLAFALKWRTMLRAFSGLSSMLGGDRRRDDPLASVEVPNLWFWGGTLVAGTLCIILGHLLFGITWWMGLFAVVFSFVLSIVAARATGETDITPISAMGKITQLACAAMVPANAVVNLMTAMVAAGSSCHSADLLTDLKSGYLLGGNPRKQLISQLFGVVAGTLVCVPVYQVIVDPRVLGSKEMPAPSAVVWAGVAKMLAKGWDSLPPGALWGILAGGLVGIAITLGEEFLPKRYARFLPSATGLGVAGIIPATNSISMFLGALVAWLWTKYHRRSADAYLIVASSGLIAGESLMGVAVKLWGAGPEMVLKIWQSLH